MADFDTLTISIIVLLVVMSVVTWFELRYLRKSNKVRRDKALKRNQQLPDEAHNALVTTRAIVASLSERSNIHSEDVDALLREAQEAYDRHNYRVTVELTGKAKERLMALKGKQQAKGDLAKLDAPPASGSSDAPTTKELLQKDFPPNYLPSKFAISMAETSVETGARAGRDVAQARTLLGSARSRFDAKDYMGALSVARLADKSARGESVVVPPAPAPPVPASSPASSVPVSAPMPSSPAVPLGSTCPSCGAPLKAGDTFCRKCGAKALATDCPTCGASLLADDLFCRKCGTRIQR